MSPSLF